MTLTRGRGRRPLLLVLVAAVGACIVTFLVACGASVDLGGSVDGSAPDVTIERSADATRFDTAAPFDDGGGIPCDPCVSPDECGGGTACARFASGADTYCGTLCPTGGGCDAGETCRSVSLVSGQSAKVCAPSSGTCPRAVGPESDGAVLDHCGVLTAPTAAADCHSCTFSCQTNGCFGGWWCNTTTRRCQRPPKNCP